MILFKHVHELKNYIASERLAGRKIGFVPTMGALHQGHLALIETCRENGNLSICSIFVNPTQFNDPKDFQKYPVTIEKDIYLLEKKGTDILFLPSKEEIYPGGTTGLRHYELGFLETILEGKFRPGHFQGVCQVMDQLLRIVEPDHLYMGQKDYQQCMVVKKLLQIIGLKTVFHACPTVRESDGLAMSSRNTRLNESERINAVTIFKTLSYLKKNIRQGDLSGLLNNAKNLLIEKDFKVDYVEIADAETLETVNEWNGKQNVVALIAAFLHEVRLIDNMLLHP
ncbi:MAG: pantoate--beta-alanine ligase [Bacteroidetes bacterium]|nr:pantoate--beta-alanine ligase [Bacteroidota bacterium]